MGLQDGVVIGTAPGPAPGPAPHGHSSHKTTCGHMKNVYRQESCCGMPGKEIGFQIVPDPKKNLALSMNPCAGKKPAPGSGYDNVDCFVSGTLNALEQSAGDVTAGYNGGMDV